MSKTIEILGEKAEYYLSHVCRTIDKKLLYLPAPDTVDRVWMASPDINGGAVRELAFEQTASGISVTLPSIKYWDMLVLEQD